jgi:hypothetical protein
MITFASVVASPWEQQTDTRQGRARLNVHNSYLIWISLPDRCLRIAMPQVQRVQ